MHQYFRKHAAAHPNLALLVSRPTRSISLSSALVSSITASLAVTVTKSLFWLFETNPILASATAGVGVGAGAGAGGESSTAPSSDFGPSESVAVGSAVAGGGGLGRVGGGLGGLVEMRARSNMGASPTPPNGRAEVPIRLFTDSAFALRV